MEDSSSRTLVLWCPDWPVLAQGATLDADPRRTPIALLDRGRVFACSVRARQEGVRRGLRLREAQARCPELIVAPYDPAADARAFEPVIAAVEALVPALQVIRPGMLALRTRGPARYYGSEQGAAAVLLDRLARQGVPEARAGVADGPFAAEQAARRAEEGHALIVPPGLSASFLAPFAVTVLGDPAFTSLLTRLGIRVLGDFARLPLDEVRARFGAEGARAHLRARGLDGRTVVPRVPPAQLRAVLALEPPLDRVDQIAFAVRSTVDEFLAGLTARLLVCTAVRIDLHTESGGASSRVWTHPRHLGAADLVDRVRWQVQGAGPGAGLDSPVVRIVLEPESVDDLVRHERGLWGEGPDERVHGGAARVQSMLGHEAVLIPLLGGGRSPAERQRLLPWGEGSPAREDTAPWPGHLPAPAPTSVYSPALPARVLDASGTEVSVDEGGRISAPPARLQVAPTGTASPVMAWAGPWRIEERWWDPVRHHRADRFQVVDGEGMAWLLALDEGGWGAEGRFD